MAQSETFKQFRKSFSYGSRTDLNFKFLKSLSDEEAAQFFQGMLWKLGDCFIDGDWDRVYEHVLYWQSQGYRDPTDYVYEEGPFALFEMDLREAQIALISSSGHFLAGSDPAPFGVVGMSQAEAADRIQDFLKAKPDLVEIPFDTPPEELRVRHGGYDIRAAQTDPDSVFPLQRLREIASEGQIGELHPMAYSFVGVCSQLRLLNEAGPEWVKSLRKEAFDAALLVPV